MNTNINDRRTTEVNSNLASEYDHAVIAKIYQDSIVKTEGGRSVDWVLYATIAAAVGAGILVNLVG